ncbi:MAG: glycogen/starch/alpha-glucan phosphorylase [Deltaproteobacteria bacterium]|nr:glycogen/starch/alpha-glucan phosphorylase [Deltaproteobacteria bacterium]MBK8714298.1 glycogen/starch/alpha-glucan phosphorylase [Deltaproteobacteria bacterium]
MTTTNDDHPAMQSMEPLAARQGTPTHQPQIVVEDDRTGMHPVTLERAVLDHLYYTCMKDPPSATLLNVYEAVAHATRDRLVQRWIRTQRAYYEQNVKRVYYLSAEFLMGRALGHNLMSLGAYDAARDLLGAYGLELSHILEEENDPGLGNGGLGRLAACFLDSMATLGFPGYGYGIRYEFGIFEQQIRDGWQVERGDAWLRYGNPWEIARPEYTVTVNMFGRIEEKLDEHGRLRVHWVDTTKLLGVPYDTPIAGYGNNTVNTLRLWRARASKEFNFDVFNDGDYRRAVEDKADSETISKVLYPNDESPEGRELRLKQQYFFVCCAIHDIIRRFKKTESDFDLFPDRAAIQLNDTHPAIAVAELMRALVDVEGVEWERAWDITQRTIAYTNHTLLPEALECWPVGMFGRMLPRHLSIILEINRRFLRQVQISAPTDEAKRKRMAIVDNDQIRMAHLAVVGSHSVNGVAQLHTDLLRAHVLSDFAQMFPHKFNNKTNGVTPRRWLLLANRRLASAITARIGPAWITDLPQLQALEQFVDDATLHEELRTIKRENKADLASLIRERNRVDVNLDSIFDTQIKRLHQYKRQLLNCLHIIALYQSMKAEPTRDWVPRTFIFGGKAAPGYAMAKLHIKLINDVASTINDDPAMRGLLNVVFLANYGVSLAERTIPATDVSEQISLAGKEASGTGNMKFAMNGALTIGTLDGANIEIREAVGAENFFLFGLDAHEAEALRERGYKSSEYIERSPRLRSALDLIASGFFSPDDPKRFDPVLHTMWHDDPFMLCADFDAYVACQEQVATAYRDPTRWAKMVVHNLAHVGRFSSDRTIREYAEGIWGVKPVQVTMR